MKNGIDYEKLVNRSLVGVVKSCLKMAEEKGLPSKHHFYITFATTFPGVHIPPHLLEQYPEEITIVLQYEFWDLKVMNDFFSVTLNFNRHNEYIVVPFGAIVNFVDPSVKFGLQFTPDWDHVPSDPSFLKAEDNKNQSEANDAQNNVIKVDFIKKK